MNHPYALCSRPDLRHTHIRHHASDQSLCGAAVSDWRIAEPGEKPACKICLETLEDREYRSRWVRDGGGSGMGVGRQI